MYTRTECRDHALYLLIGIYTVKACLLHVQYFAADRHDSLKLDIAAVLRRSQSRISLDDKYLASLGISLRAVLELARKGAAFKSRLAPRELLGLACRISRALRQERLLADGTCHLGILLKVVCQLVGQHAADRRLSLGVAELLLGLPLELRLLHLDADYRSDTLSDILARQIFLIVLEELVFSGIVIDRLGQRDAKSA